MDAAYKLTNEQVRQANELVGQTPTVVARQLIRRIENERKLACGSIMSASRTWAISEARYDAIVQLYQFFNIGERRLSINKIASIFDLDESTVWYALKKRGLR